MMEANVTRMGPRRNRWLQRLRQGYERLISVVARDTRLAVFLIFSLAILVRLLYVVVVGLDSPPTYDGIGYDILATNLLQRRVYGGEAPTAFRPPGYPLFLAGIYLIFGHSFTAVRLIQVGVDALTCVLVYAVGARFFNRRVAFLAATGMSLYPLQIYMVGEFYSETFSFLLQLVALWLAVWMVERRHWSIPLLLGVSLAATTLTRPTAVFWIPLMVLWVGLLPLPWKHKARDVALVLLGLALLFGPWIVRNYIVFREFIPIASLSGVGVWAGNNPLSGGGGMLPDERTWGEGAPEWGWMGWEGLSEVESSRRFLERGLSWIKENPLAFATLVPRKLLRLWSPTSFGVQFSRHASPLLTAMIMPPYLMFLALAAGGMILSRRGWKEQFPLYALILGVNTLVALTYGATRYGIAMASCLCLYAAVSLDTLGSQLASGSGGTASPDT
jgi:4-amino-4-deoxy-L-arabinose transferase-like glycosyltransferase